MKNSAIEWTHHTFNPWWGCAKVSPGCAFCYADRDATRYGKKLWGNAAPREPRSDSQGAGGEPRAVDDPVPTIPTRGAHSLIVPYHSTSPCKSADEPLGTATTRDRFAFITAAFGEREGQVARNRSIEEPVPTVCAKGRVPLVEGVEDDFADIDILFRMLEPHELAAAMGFPPSYRFQGTKGDRTRQIGNAVPVQTAAALVRAILGIAAPVRPRRRVARAS